MNCPRLGETKSWGTHADDWLHWQGRILTMLMGQYSVVLWMLPLKVLNPCSVSFSVSLLMSRIKSPLEGGAVKKRLHEFMVFPGLRSSSTLDSTPSSGRNLSCSWLLQKISARFVGGCMSIDESESVSVIRKGEKIIIHHHQDKKIWVHESENVWRGGQLCARKKLDTIRCSGISPAFKCSFTLG